MLKCFVLGTSLGTGINLLVYGIWSYNNKEQKLVKT